MQSRTCPTVCRQVKRDAPGQVGCSTPALLISNWFWLQRALGGQQSLGRRKKGRGLSVLEYFFYWDLSVRKMDEIVFTKKKK